MSVAGVEEENTAISSLSTKVNGGHWKKKISFCLDKKKTGL